jgi:hypothetical protein
MRVAVKRVAVVRICRVAVATTCSRLYFAYYHQVKNTIRSICPSPSQILAGTVTGTVATSQFCLPLCFTFMKNTDKPMPVATL